MRPRGSIVAAIDIGTTKICCFIARVENEPRILGIGQQIARGVRGGTIIDLEAAGASISGAVHAAEQMAGAEIDRAVVNLSGGYRASRIVKTEIAVGRREISDADMRQVLERGYAMRDAPDRQVIHSIPVGFSIDDSRGILDPRGMVGERLGVDMHIVTAAIASVRNHTAALGRSHLEAEALVVSPYAAGLACLVEDEKRPRRHGRRHGRRHDDDRRVLRRQSDLRRRGAGRRHARDERHRARPVDAAGACRAA